MKHFNKFLVMAAVAACFGMVSCDDDDDQTHNKPTTGTENGHKWVDLGLTSGTKWATCNVGADAPESYGDYYAWGEVTTYYSAGGDTDDPIWKEGYSAGYDMSTYFDTNDGGSTFVKYNYNGDKTELEDADDVAVQTWGGKWSMPTFEQLKELHDECYWVWTNTYNDKSVSGYIVYKVKTEGDKGVKVYSGNDADSSYGVDSDAHIFLPAAGYRDCGTLYRAGYDFYYWSRSLYTKVSGYAYGLRSRFGSNDMYVNCVRCYGQSVRPVCPATE